jgi:hypothetical protein
LFQGETWTDAIADLVKHLKKCRPITNIVHMMATDGCVADVGRALELSTFIIPKDEEHAANCFSPN